MVVSTIPNTSMLEKADGHGMEHRIWSVDKSKSSMKQQLQLIFCCQHAGNLYEFERAGCSTYMVHLLRLSDSNSLLFAFSLPRLATFGIARPIGPGILVDRWAATTDPLGTRMEPQFPQSIASTGSPGIGSVLIYGR